MPPLSIAASASSQVAQATGTSLAVTEEVTVTPVSPELAALAGKPDEEWTEADLALFITQETERLNGPQLPVADAAGILSGFWSRYGHDAVRIARRAFEAHQGQWRGAPVTLRRFADSQDGFFAGPLLAEVHSAAS